MFRNDVLLLFESTPSSAEILISLEVEKKQATNNERGLLKR